MKDSLILITKWNIEFNSVNSAEYFASYSGIEMRLVIQDFKVKQEEEIKMSKYPTNLFRDDEAKALILDYIK